MLGVVVANGTLGGGPALAASDILAPVINTNAAASFLVGGVIGPSSPADESDGVTWEIPELVKWSVTDDSGQICDFRIYAMAADSWPDPDNENGRLLLGMHSRTPSPYAGQVVDTFYDYDGAAGGNGDVDAGWKLVASDCSGNTARVDVVSLGETSVLQEDNRHTTYEYSRDPGALTYAGTWGTTTCACASWNAMRRTTSKGSSFTFTRTYERDDHLALVMAKGPGCGQADVFVDGVKTATINTHASTNTNRVIVFDKWMSAGVHKVRVVNRATTGHPRIDLDAVLTN
ncbi:MAG: hypothetical protein U0R78_15725 [Nocardioidaceae bacterium]